MRTLGRMRALPDVTREPSPCPFDFVVGKGILGSFRTSVAIAGEQIAPIAILVEVTLGRIVGQGKVLCPVDKVKLISCLRLAFISEKATI